MKEDEFLKKFKEKFKFSDDCGIIFTDGSRQTGNISTGVGFTVIHGEDTGYSMSIDARCSIYIAELMAVEKAIGYALDNEWYKDLLILSDNQRVVKDIKNNKLVINKHRIASSIREKIFEYLGRVEYLGRAKERGNQEVRLVIGWVPAHIKE